jgi:hypothetical protein
MWHRNGSFLFLILCGRDCWGCLKERVVYANFCHRVCHCSLSLMCDVLDVNISCTKEMLLAELCPEFALIDVC